MALRDKLVERVQPHLEPGEEVEQVLLAQTGPNPLLSVAIIGSLLYFFLVKRRIVAVTDRAIVVLRAGSFSGTSVKGVVARLPRQAPFRPEGRLWSRVTVGSEKLWVHRRFKADLLAADAKLAQPPAA